MFCVYRPPYIFDGHLHLNQNIESNLPQLSMSRPGARFSKIPGPFRARNQIFKSKYEELERGSWLTNCSILFH